MFMSRLLMGAAIGTLLDMEPSGRSAALAEASGQVGHLRGV